MKSGNRTIRKSIRRLLLVSSSVIAGGMTSAADAVCGNTTGAYTGHRLGKDPATVIAMARRGVPQAQTELAALYRNGIGVKADGYEAYEWYRRAAENGDAEAQFRLGLMYLHGDVITSDEYAAMDWLERAANQGHPRAEVVYEQVLNSELPWGC